MIQEGKYDQCGSSNDNLIYDDKTFYVARGQNTCHGKDFQKAKGYQLFWF